MTSFTRNAFVLVCLLPTAYCLLLSAAGDDAARTVWDGVYTDEQAERGRTAYQQACVGCHREDLRGDSTAPSLVGESFTFLWGDMEVGELVARVQKLMPPERPGSLPAQTYTDIIAFVLTKNEFPAGHTELGADPDSLHALITAKANK
jgi:S-disulfanyl-L-cysteine oxidoreductase SoxD